jgi:hypothetical protein
MLTRADVERITENVLSELSINIRGGDFTSPNTRIVELKLGDRIISTDYFDVVQKREYEG